VAEAGEAPLQVIYLRLGATISRNHVAWQLFRMKALN
jgi:hypothetical protein